MVSVYDIKLVSYWKLYALYFKSLKYFKQKFFYKRKDHLILVCIVRSIKWGKASINTWLNSLK